MLVLHFARQACVVGWLLVGPFGPGGVCGVEGVRTAYGESAEEDLRTEAGELGRGRWTGGL